MINVSAGGKLRLLSGRSLDRSVEKEPRERRMNEKSPGAGEDRCNFSPAAQGEPVATCFIRVSPALRRELLKIASHEHSPSARVRRFRDHGNERILRQRTSDVFVPFHCAGRALHACTMFSHFGSPLSSPLSLRR